MSFSISKQTTGLVRAVLISAVLVPPGVAQELDDRDIARAVETEFWSDQVVDANRVDTKSNRGIVTLTGNVSDILAKERAATIASGIVGVRAVVNRITVNPVTQQSDEDLRQAVEYALLSDPVADRYEVDVTAADGTITLTGAVDSSAEKTICENVAKSVSGVKAIENELDVNYTDARSDIELKLEIERRLQNDVLVDDLGIDVAVKLGEVSLTGSVGSLAEKNRARSDAYVRGVKTVDASGLEIIWWARDEQRRKSLYVTRTDQEIERAVEDALLYDPRVSSFRPSVEVERGNVTLSGVVDNASAKRAAEQDARNVAGVWRVINHLKVRPDTIPADGELEKRVDRTFRNDPHLAGWNIVADAHAGWVHLKGEVDNAFKKWHAENVAHRVKGVVQVMNQLTFEHTWTWKPDGEIEQAVEDQLWWSTFVDGNDIDVAVEDGVVTLSGHVDTWGERMDAEKQAYQGGAKHVVNRLMVAYRYYGPVHGHGWLARSRHD